jgi:hypothetical protein
MVPQLGYTAGLGASMAAAKAASRSENARPGNPQNPLAGAAPDRSTNRAANGATASADPPPKQSDVSGVVVRAKPLWDEMTTYDDIDQDTLFHHSQSSPFWLSAQANFVARMHPRFNSPYRGPNSFNGAEEQAV